MQTKDQRNRDREGCLDLLDRVQANPSGTLTDAAWREALPWLHSDRQVRLLLATINDEGRRMKWRGDDVDAILNRVRDRIAASG